MASFVRARRWMRSRISSSALRDQSAGSSCRAPAPTGRSAPAPLCGARYRRAARRATNSMTLQASSLIPSRARRTAGPLSTIPPRPSKVRLACLMAILVLLAKVHGITLLKHDHGEGQQARRAPCCITTGHPLPEERCRSRHDRCTGDCAHERSNLCTWAQARFLIVPGDTPWQRPTRACSTLELQEATARERRRRPRRARVLPLSRSSWWFSPRPPNLSTCSSSSSSRWVQLHSSLITAERLHQPR